MCYQRKNIKLIRLLASPMNQGNATLEPTEWVLEALVEEDFEDGGGVAVVSPEGDVDGERI